MGSLVAGVLFSASLPAADQENRNSFADLSLLVATELPCTWPASNWPLFHMSHYQRIGPLHATNSDILVIDGNTGTQIDFPPHSIPLPDSGLPNAGPLGKAFSDRIPAWQFCGEACVVDCSDLLDQAPRGHSPLVKKEQLVSWEKKHRPLGPGDVVLFASGYNDRYYRPFPAGSRFLADPLAGKAPAWPDPDPECMEYLGSRKVMTLGCDSPTMGPLPDLSEPVHFAGLRHGMIWTEGAIGLRQLPSTTAFYCCMGPKHVGGPYTEGRAFAVLGPLARRLIEATRRKTVVDLSVALAPDLPVWWPGTKLGEHRHPYLKVLFGFSPVLGVQHQTHILDSHTGTHLVPPAYALPSRKGDRSEYAEEVRGWLADYEGKYGAVGTSSITTEKVALAQTCGRARIIDVRPLLTGEGTGSAASPEITAAWIQRYEKQKGALEAGDIVLFHSAWSDRYFKPFPQGNACLAEPLDGKKPGWPAPGPDALAYLADRGIRCVGTDCPTLGGVEPRKALWAYWMLGSKGMVAVEYLTNLDGFREGGTFLFAALKIRGCHGGPGRAIGLY